MAVRSRGRCGKIAFEFPIRLHDDTQLAGCLGNQATVHVFLGNLRQALKLRAEAERLCQAQGIMVELPKHQFARAVILAREGQTLEALRLLEQGLQLAESLLAQTQTAVALPDRLTAQAEESLRRARHQQALLWL